jgi:hypothetical protein
MRIFNMSCKITLEHQNLWNLLNQDISCYDTLRNAVVLLSFGNRIIRLKNRQQAHADFGVHAVEGGLVDISWQLVI